MANASLFGFQEADTGGTLWIQTTWKALSNLDECGALTAFCLRGEVSQSLPLPPVVVETVVQDKQYKCGGFSLTQPFGFWEPMLWTRRIWTSLSLQRCFLEWKTGNRANVQGQGNTIWSVHTVVTVQQTRGRTRKSSVCWYRTISRTDWGEHAARNFSLYSLYLWVISARLSTQQNIRCGNVGGKQADLKSLRPAWLMYQVPGQLEVYNETVSKKKKKQHLKKNKQ